MSEDEDIRKLLEAAMAPEQAPPAARNNIQQRIGARELLLGAVELFTVVPASIIRDFVSGPASPTEPEGTHE